MVKPLTWLQLASDLIHIITYIGAATLTVVCKATGKWATHRHLHDELKWACGYVRMRWNGLANCHMRVIDSISFDEMDQKEFNKYFEMAMAKLSEAIGYDPLQR